MSEFDSSYIERLANEYKKDKDFIEKMEKRLSAVRKELLDAVQDYGLPDDKGHMWLNAGEVVLKKERRVSRSFDVASAEQWAKDNGYWDDVKEVIEVLSEDKILGLAWENPDVSDQIQSFYVEKESWAFKV